MFTILPQVFCICQGERKRRVHIVEHLNLHSISHRGNGLRITDSNCRTDGIPDHIDGHHRPNNQQNECKNTASANFPVETALLTGVVHHLGTINIRINQLSLII